MPTPTPTPTPTPMLKRVHGAMPNAPCPMPNAQCPMPNAHCPLPLPTRSCEHVAMNQAVLWTSLNHSTFLSHSHSNGRGTTVITEWQWRGDGSGDALGSFGRYGAGIMDHELSISSAFFLAALARQSWPFPFSLGSWPCARSLLRHVRDRNEVGP